MSNRAGTKILAFTLVLVVFGVGGLLLWQGAAPDAVVPDISVPKLSEAASPAQPAHPKDWSLFSTGNGFTFYGPFRTGHDRLQGEDSAVGRIEGAGFALEYDFGLYSNPLEGMKNLSDYSESHVKIDGRDAVIRRGTIMENGRQRYAIGLYVPQVYVSWGLRPDGNWVSLEIGGEAGTEAERKTVEKLFSTIRFDRPMPDGYRR